MSQAALFPSDNGMHRRAIFVEGRQSGRRMRISLQREWEDSGPSALVIGCNPSHAGAETDDRTSLWWNRWFKQAGFSGYTAMNLYPFITACPHECKRIASWEDNGPDWYARDEIQYNFQMIMAAAEEAAQIFVCWGAIAWDTDWVDQVVEEIRSLDRPDPHLWCWGATKSGAPKHPMARGRHRIPENQEALIWQWPPKF